MNQRKAHEAAAVALVFLGVMMVAIGTKVYAQAEAYDPDAKVYLDALWLRAHAEDCPSLVLKEKKKTMTLAEADKAGARIGESGQSGRENCCFSGYKRKHPAKVFAQDIILSGNDSQRNYKHLPGCHRYWPDRSHLRRPMSEWLADGFKVCPHCIERGPNVATVSDEAWNKIDAPNTFVAPEGWVPKPFSPDTLPSEEELELLIQETLGKGKGILELPFTDPVASTEQFVTMRFFFPVTSWHQFYMLYRATGDGRLHDKLLVSARHYHKLSVEYPSVAQWKASTPEGLPYMLSMAACARITLQLERKAPGTVGQDEIDEAQAFLTTMVSVLKPTLEGSDNLDSEMGVPQKLADDFRFRAFNRSFNGIGTLGLIAAALEDLQAVRKMKAYQPTIDRYRKVIRTYTAYFFSQGDFAEFNGKNHFYYPYKPYAGEPRMVDGQKIFKRPEDAGHYSHTTQGLMFLYEAVPESGVDDDFMTAVANAVYHNATTKIQRHGRMVLSGHLQSPTAYKVRPYGSKRGGHQYSPARNKFYVLQAFRDDMIDGLCQPLNEQKKIEVNSESDKRISTLYAHYVKALRKDQSLIHLEEKK